MTLRPDVEALVQGALDDSLSPEDRKTLDRLLSTDPDVRARAAELHQLSSLIESIGQVDAPPTLAADVLAVINKSARSSHVVEFSRATPAGHAKELRSSVTGRGLAINKKVIWGLAAAAVLVLAVVGYNANPSVNEGTEATIGTAQRYQAPQIDTKDVAVGDTSVQALLQTETWDAIQKDETLRTLLQDASFRGKLQDPELRRSLSDADLLRAIRSQGVARALADPEMARKFADAELTRRLIDPAAQKKLMDPEFARNLSDPELKKLIGDADLISRLADADLRTMYRSPALVKALADANFRANLAKADVLAAMVRPGFQAAMNDPGLSAALQAPGFAEAVSR